MAKFEIKDGIAIIPDEKFLLFYKKTINII
jgi:hypothetical protein